MIHLTNELSNKFRNMSVLCALFVVIIHCRPYFDPGSLPWYLKEFLENGVCEMAVPFFFLTSGFFISPKLLQVSGGYKSELKKRVRSLLMPYCLWVLLFWVFTMSVQHKLFLPSGRDLGLDVFNGPILTPLWYVRALMVLVVLSPLILAMLRKWPRSSLAILGTVYAVVIPYYPMPNWDKTTLLLRLGPLPLLGLFYFSLGMAWRLELVSFPKWKVDGWWTLGMGILLMAMRVCMLDMRWEWMAAYCGFLAIPLLIGGMLKVIPGTLWPSWIVSCSFPIYVMHKFFYPIYDMILFPVFDLLTYGLEIGFVFGASVAMTYAIRKLVPRMAAVVFGGR